MFRVNHNGTEDWTDAAKHDVRGRAVFSTIEEARAFGAQVAAETVEWQVRECGMDLEQARHMLRDNADGVPVQIISASAGRVVETIDPSDLKPTSGEDYEREQDELLALREKYGCEAVVPVGLYKIGVRVSHDKDGEPFLELLGLDCNLEGEQPGIYYPAPITD